MKKKTRCSYEEEDPVVFKKTRLSKDAAENTSALIEEEAKELL